MTPSPVTQPLWTPSEERIQTANLTRFIAQVREKRALPPMGYHDLYRWSVEESEAFWSEIWDFCQVVAETKGEVVVEAKDKMPGACWFPQARLNFAENLLRRRDNADALVFRGEDRVERRLSFADLYDGVSRLAQAMRAMGVQKGDRVAAVLPNMPETVIAMLATVSLGAIWTSCSPDFGVAGLQDRFGQTEPKLLFAVDGYRYNGKTHNCLDKFKALVPELPGLEQVVIVPYAGSKEETESIPWACTLGDWIQDFAPREIQFTYTNFNDPLYILYSSGTTGKPKCIVHGVGGTLLQHLKEHQLHSDIKRDDRVLFFTTCGWMMWNWLVSALASEAALMLYDGSPFYPDGNTLWDFAQKERFTFFGTSAKYIEALNKAGLNPKSSHRLDNLRTLASTGSPLTPESFDYVYASIKSDLNLASLCGGTDIISCFMLGCPVIPVWRGEIQSPGLGMKIEVFDPDGKAIEGETGELVCTRAFPSMPIGFWNDNSGARYHLAYFAQYPNTWCHGDLIELTEQGGIIVHGRSDATLNPGGVRIGTAEIYRQVEQFDEVAESVVVGQEWAGDIRVVLFLKLRDSLTLDKALTDQIKQKIRQNCTPRHVPAVIHQVHAIPRTQSGKITELAVRDAIHARPVKNDEALANPEALDEFRQWANIR